MRALGWNPTFKEIYATALLSLGLNFNNQLSKKPDFNNQLSKKPDFNNRLSQKPDFNNRLSQNQISVVSKLMWHRKQTLCEPRQGPHYRR